MVGSRLWVSGMVVLGLTLACGASKRQGPPNGTEDEGGAGNVGLGGAPVTGGAGASAGVGTGGVVLGVGGTGGTGGGGGMTNARGGTSGNAGRAGAAAATGGSPAAGGVAGHAGTAGSGARAGAGGDPSGGAGGAQAGAAGTAGAPMQATLASCATWTLELAKGSTSTAELTNGGLLLTQPAGSWSDSGPFNSALIALSQAGLSGDFDIVVTLDHFQPGDGMVANGPLFEAGVWFKDTAGEISQINGTVGQETGQVTGIIWPVPNMGTGDTKSLNHLADATWLIDASGTIELQRAGDSATATTTVNGYGITYTASPFPTDPLTLFLSMNNRDMDLGMVGSSVRVTSVKVTGQGIASDSFDCAQ